MANLLYLALSSVESKIFSSMSMSEFILVFFQYLHVCENVIFQEEVILTFTLAYQLENLQSGLLLSFKIFYKFI